MLRYLLLASALFAAAAAHAEPLRVMTFNVRYPNPDDGPNYWDNRKELVVETIRQYDPDVFGMQELVDSQGVYIDEQLEEYAWFGVSRDGAHGDEHMGVFYKRDKLFPLETGNFWLSETPDVPGSMSWDISLPRMVTWARFRRASGEEFYLYNTHFPHRREDAVARYEAAKVIVADFRRRVPAFAKLLVMGDFNSAADSDVHELFAQELTDAWDSGAPRKGTETTSSGWTGRTEGRRIDWILYRGDWKATEIETVNYHRGDRYPSDHYPVFAIIE